MYEIDPKSYVVFDLRGDYQVTMGENPVEWRRNELHGVVESSLWLAMSKYNADPQLAVVLSNIFGWTIDFFGLQKQDEFRVIYEQEYVDGKSLLNFDVLDEKGEKISRENWKIVYADSEETRSGNRTADKIYDLQESTFWQTVDNTAYPHQVVIDLGKEYNVTGFRILPRAEQGAPGMIKDYKVYVKSADFNY